MSTTQKWHVTTDLHEALVGNYIGEVVIRLTPLMDAMTNNKFQPFKMYYYGEPDAALRVEFGYK